MYDAHEGCITWMLMGRGAPIASAMRQNSHTPKVVSFDSP
jgi:hypothetical protein